MQHIREWKAGYIEANRLDLEEARSRTPEQRFLRHQNFLASLNCMGLLRAREDDLEYHLRWQELREKWIARHS